MSHVFGFLPKKKRIIISRTELDKVYTMNKKTCLKNLVALQGELINAGLTEEEIKGLIYFVNGGQPKEGQGRNVNPQHYPYGELVGWKIHLRVKPKNYMFVYLWLKFNCPYGWKHLEGGEPGEQDFTIYVGSWDNAIIFIRIANEEISDKLEEPTDQMRRTELTIRGKISGRFNFQAETYQGHDVSEFFTRYGWLGIPALTRYSGTIYLRSIKFKENKKKYIRFFVIESIKILTGVFFKDGARRRYFLGSNDVVLKIIENSLRIVSD